MAISISDEERFWARVDRTGDCWEWLGGGYPYGNFTVKGRRIRPHRYAYLLTHGEVPPGIFVCHRCDNPRCVRPEHLFLGTGSENVRDAAAKGRWWSREVRTGPAACQRPKVRWRAPAATRFWAQVRKTDACWTWTGPFRGSYGKFRMGGKAEPQTSAHRAAWMLTFGPIPEGLFVCHHCDNRACVRPDHLFLGTPSDNMKDCLRKGRMPRGVYPDRRGERATGAKLVAAQVLAIRARYAAGGVIQAQLAREYGVTQAAIHLILTGKNWSHLLPT